MSGTYRFVKFLKNHIYPTYQLHAYMANDKTAPDAGLRLAALTTIHWLKSRLGDAAPKDWENMPSPTDYLSATDDDLPSLYLNQGHVINIVSLPDKGIWTMQITEPDLGSDPGNPNQKRQAVPGRIIETNIAFRITGKQVECGFKTVISDPVGTVPEAEVYRTTVVKLLMENPAFGLKQVTDIPMKLSRLTSDSQIKTMLFVLHHAENQLPAVIFSQPVQQKKQEPAAMDLSKAKFSGAIAMPKLDLKISNLPKDLAKPVSAAKTETVAVDPQYDMDKFMYYTFSNCRTYILEEAVRKSFTAQSGIKFNAGDIIVIYPTALGGGERVIPYREPESSWDDHIQTIEKGIKDSLKARDIDFGQIMFLSGAREHLLHISDELLESAEAADTHFKTEIEQLNAFWKNELSQKQQELEAVIAQVQNQKSYSSRLEDEKTKLREDFSKERDKLQAEIDTHLETIRFLKRRYDQPQDYDGIAGWVNEHFSDRLFLHPKAVSRMLSKSNQCASVDLVCDALDFLATDYWETRYLQVPRDVMLTRCSEKYGRPFDISPVGQATIEFTPSEYRIKYYRNAQGKEMDSDLNCHLRVGNDSENLLRIYFLHDDEQRLIVIGSLPDHFRSVKIQ